VFVCLVVCTQEALGRLRKFACESIFEIKVAGRFTSDLVRAAVKVHPDISLKMFLPQLCQAVIDRASGNSCVILVFVVFLLMRIIRVNAVAVIILFRSVFNVCSFVLVGSGNDDYELSEWHCIVRRC